MKESKYEKSNQNVFITNIARVPLGEKSPKGDLGSGLYILYRRGPTMKLAIISTFINIIVLHKHVALGLIIYGNNLSQRLHNLITEITDHYEYQTKHAIENLHNL